MSNTDIVDMHFTYTKCIQNIHSELSIRNELHLTNELPQICSSMKNGTIVNTFNT